MYPDLLYSTVLYGGIVAILGVWKKLGDLEGRIFHGGAGECNFGGWNGDGDGMNGVPPVELSPGDDQKSKSLLVNDSAEPAHVFLVFSLLKALLLTHC